MKIKTTRFGEIDCCEQDMIFFPEGILGFEDMKQYIVLDIPEFAPLRWLQSAEAPWLAFVVCDPTLLLADYRVQVPKKDLEVIGLADESQGFVSVILAVGDGERPTTANLKGPLVFNFEKRQAKQIVLAESDYSTRHPLEFTAEPSVVQAV